MNTRTSASAKSASGTKPGSRSGSSGKNSTKDTDPVPEENEDEVRDDDAIGSVLRKGSFPDGKTSKDTGGDGGDVATFVLTEVGDGGVDARIARHKKGAGRGARQGGMRGKGPWGESPVASPQYGGNRPLASVEGDSVEPKRRPPPRVPSGWMERTDVAGNPDRQAGRGRTGASAESSRDSQAAPQPLPSSRPPSSSQSTIDETPVRHVIRLHRTKDGPPRPASVAAPNIRGISGKGTAAAAASSPAYMAAAARASQAELDRRRFGAGLPESRPGSMASIDLEAFEEDRRLSRRQSAHGSPQLRGKDPGPASGPLGQLQRQHGRVTDLNGGALGPVAEVCNDGAEQDSATPAGEDGGQTESKPSGSQQDEAETLSPSDADAQPLELEDDADSGGTVGS